MDEILANAYLVGGAVRDEFLGLPVTERDWVVVGLTPAHMQAAGFQTVGKDFPVFLHPDTREEYALARTERKTGKGYTGFTCYSAPDVTLEEDLQRRDLTINAMAKDKQGNLIDPYNGRRDLSDKVLRHVSDAFSEDPLRVLRLARFTAKLAAQDFTVAEETHAMMSQMVAGGELADLVPERVWQETYKALQTVAPDHYFQTLMDCGALEVLFPELAALEGVPNPPAHHPEIDTWVHNQLVLQQTCRLSRDSEVRFAALLHDLGKAKTPESEWPRHIGHEKAGLPLVKALCQRLRVPRGYQDLAYLVCRYHLACHQVLEMRPPKIIKLLMDLDAFRRPERLEKFLLACEGDARGRAGFEDKPYPQRTYLWSAFEMAKAADYSDLLQQELPGEALAEKIKARRVEAIRSLKK